MDFDDFDDTDWDRFLDPKGIGARVEVLERRRIRKGPVRTLHPPPEFKYACAECGEGFWTCTRPHHWVSRQALPVCRACKTKAYNAARRAARAASRAAELAGRRCRHCGAALAAATRRRQFCGVACRVAHHRAQDRAKDQAKDGA